MEEFDSDNEIIEFAIASEIEAFQFYTALAERMQTSGKQEIFEELAKEELAHKAKLELELVKLGHVANMEDISEITVADYDLSNEFEFDMEYKDILVLAMEKEEMAFKQYVDLAAGIHDEGSRNTLLTLAEEEVKHKLRFEYEYNALFKTH